MAMDVVVAMAEAVGDMAVADMAAAEGMEVAEAVAATRNLVWGLLAGQ